MSFAAGQADKKTRFASETVARNFRYSPSKTIRFASFLGDNAFDFYVQVVAYLGNVTGFPTEFISNLSPEEQDKMVDTGEIQGVFTCGLPYIRKADRDPPLLRPLVAPVMPDRRYQNQPIYFSDVIVPVNAPYKSFADLRGAVFAYNEIHSWSGYVLVCHYLQILGESDAFFGAMVPSGSHAASMAWVANGVVDAAAIDSVVLSMEALQQPQHLAGIRVVAQLGPSPMPPIAVSTTLAEEVYSPLRKTLLNMHTNRRGRSILKQGGILRFKAIDDADYDSMRQIMETLQRSK